MSYDEKHREFIKNYFKERSLEYEKYELESRKRGNFDDAFIFQEYAKQTKNGEPAEGIWGIDYSFSG